MATTLTTPADTTTVANDPKRPVKAVVALAIPIALAGLQAALNAYADAAWDLNDTLTVLLALVGAAAVYLAPNPIVKTEERANEL